MLWWFLEMCDVFGFEIDRNGVINICEVRCQARYFYVLYQADIKLMIPSEISDTFSIVGRLSFIFFVPFNIAYIPLS